jgi:hypothetical protein
MGALPPRWSSLLAIVLLVLSGCASVPGPEYGRELPVFGSERVELADVPFFPQEEYQCGPAALATVLQNAGIARTPAQLAPEVYLPQRHGSLQLELLGASRRAGAVPYVLHNQPDDLLREVAAGHPVVVLQNLGWSMAPQWHYAVVVGFDLTGKTLMLRSGTTERLQMPLDDFDRSWARAERWAFVALPPGRLPATASEQDYVAAATAFERVAPTLGPQAYETALRAWPKNLLARLALGNAAYRQRQLEFAQTQYRQATADHPESGDAWNNYAQVRFEQGHSDEALAAARRAVAIGGPHLSTYVATLRAIEPAGSVLK